MFCPKCKSIMLPQRKGEKKVLVCRCGHSTDGEIHIKEHVTHHHKEIEVVHEGAHVVEAKESIDCPKCRHGEAHAWAVQNRSSDEPPTEFRKCIKCKHTWRLNR